MSVKFLLPLWYLRHIAKYCKVRFTEGFSDPEDKTPYGPWLRSPVPMSVRSWYVSLGQGILDSVLGPTSPRRCNANMVWEQSRDKRKRGALRLKAKPFQGAAKWCL
ncbi:hypothetical protein Salat_2546300 [Sesamum alatum]|uniref:Uncharacterized protein n=1 Tax=Sesamum alatum TaxID=300844 RepID=A0AAE1XT92_9LAMI|nr:hypothetical protein Salat_2546300 [Sesamum alatum]